MLISGPELVPGLIEGVHFIGGPLNRGFTVLITHIPLKLSQLTVLLVSSCI